MSDCKHDWRHTYDGIECNLCRQTASVGWLIDELSDAEGLLADYRAQRDASDTTRREWEVRAATSYRDGRAAGLLEAAAKLAELRDEWEVMMGDGSVAHNCGKIAHGHVIALAPPAAEPRDEGES